MFVCVIKGYLNVGATNIIGEIIVKDNLNIAIKLKPLKIVFSESTQQNCEILCWNISRDRWNIE